MQVRKNPLPFPAVGCDRGREGSVVEVGDTHSLESTNQMVVVVVREKPPLPVVPFLVQYPNVIVRGITTEGFFHTEAMALASEFGGSHYHAPFPLKIPRS